MQLNLLLTFLCPILITLVNGSHVISNSSKDCSTTNGQIVRLDWTKCTGQKYRNLNPIVESNAHKYIIHLPGQDFAKICFKDQFVVANIYLDNGQFGSNQQKFHIDENQDYSIINIISHDFDNNNNIIKTYPTAIPIREAKFIGSNAPSDTISSSTPDDEEIILYRPPNYDISISYC